MRCCSSPSGLLVSCTCRREALSADLPTALCPQASLSASRCTPRGELMRCDVVMGCRLVACLHALAACVLADHPHPPTASLHYCTLTPLLRLALWLLQPRFEGSEVVGAQVVRQGGWGGTCPLLQVASSADLHCHLHCQAQPRVAASSGCMDSAAAASLREAHWCILHPRMCLQGACGPLCHWRREAPSHSAEAAGRMLCCMVPNAGGSRRAGVAALQGAAQQPELQENDGMHPSFPAGAAVVCCHCCHCRCCCCRRCHCRPGHRLQAPFAIVFLYPACR